MPVWEAGGREPRAGPRREVIAHHALPARFDRYIFTAGYNTIINRRQFGFTDLQLADRVPLPRPDLPRHAWTSRSAASTSRCATRRARPTTTPSPGSPTPGCCAAATSSSGPRPTRATRRRCSATRGSGPPRSGACSQLEAEFLLPGHGFPVIGADRVRQALTDTADLLDSLVDQTLAVMNAGGRLDDAIHAVRVPAALEARPYLQPVYDEPEFIVHTVWRQYGGWWDGNPATLQAGPRARPGRRAGRAGRRGRRPGRRALRAAGPGRADAARGRAEAAEGALRLAGHLAEHAWLARPDDEGVQRARHEVFAARAARATSTMARGVFTWAANESTSAPATHPH